MRETLSLSEKTKNGGQTKNRASQIDIVNIENKGEVKFFHMTESMDDLVWTNSSFLKMAGHKTERAPIIRYRRIHRKKNSESNRVPHEQNSFQMAGR